MAEKAKRQRKAKVVTNVESGELTFNFVDGGSFVAKSHLLPDGIRAQLTLHGLKQKLADAYADPDVDPRRVVPELFRELENGTWSTRGEGKPYTTRLAEAVFEVYQGSKPWAKSVETVQDYLSSLYLRDGKMFTQEPGDDGEFEFDNDDEHKAALAAIRKSPKVKAVLDRKALEDAQRRAAESAKNAETAEDILA